LKEKTMRRAAVRLGGWALCGLALILGGCNRSTGGGGGGNGSNDNGSVQDPLPEFQLGDDEQLDADVAAITAADNDAVDCIGDTVQFTDEGTLLSLKQGYAAAPSPDSTFPEFVAEIALLEQAKSTEICDTTLENASEELLALVQRLTATRNRGRECIGEDPVFDDENSLRLLKIKFLENSVQVFPTLVEFANSFVPAAEDTTDAQCAGG